MQNNDWREVPVVETCDVLVVGSGLAGCSAAIAAAREGARVVLAGAGATFSGSSNFPGTWGMGLVGPRDAADAADLERTILEAGCGVADPALVHVLVGGVDAAVARLREMGAGLVEAHDEGQRDFIPCFDHTVRSWHGIDRAGYAAAAGRELARLGVVELPGLEVVDVVEDARRVRGCVLHGHEQGFVCVAASAVVLATGGFAGLYGSAGLCCRDSSGRGTAVALAHGASLVNAEFMQVMPAIVNPPIGAIFNERTFRHCELAGFGDAALLASRAAHGPFTSRLADRAVDLAIFAAGDTGAHVTWHLPDPLPEFMQTYFDWFDGVARGSARDGVDIALRAQASNGGIRIDEHGRVVGGPVGLLACGEATGGMHGADRLGGLSTANCLVFGDRAGAEAARIANASQVRGCAGACVAMECAEWAWHVPLKVAYRLGNWALVEREAESLARVDEELAGLVDRVDEEAAPTDDHEEAMAVIRARQGVMVARALVAAMQARPESRGSHYRCDFPREDPAFAHAQAVRLAADGRSPEVQALLA